jgi:soluble lytic murein transglycosylase
MRLRTGCPTPLLCAALLAVSVWPAHADLTPSRPGLRPIAGSVQVAMSDLEAFGLIGDPTAFARPLGDADYLPKILAAMRDNDFSEAEILKSKLAAPAARAVAEWVAIRMGEPMSLERMIAFQRDNPEWPNSNLLKRRIEDALLASRKSPARIRAFFAERPPVTGAGRVALTFALKADGLDAQAADLARHVWREESFGPEIESKILDQFPDVITQADHRFRMERLLFKENWSAATRAASRAGKDYETLVKARMGLYQGGKKAEKAFAAVPAALRTDSSYIFSRVLFLRRKDKPAEAAQAMASAPRDPELLVDGDEWWAERRLIARKLLDKADAKAAYDVVSGHGAESPVQQIEAEFHSGWIALRFLKDPALAGKHFAQAANVASSPISVARAAYWQGRAAEAAGAAEDARHYYVRAADQPITYYGQLARQTLGIPVALRQPQALSEEARKAFEGRTSIQALRLLNQIGEQELAIGLSAELAQSLLDPGQLDVLAAVAEEDGNPRAMLAIGKTAVQRGFPLDRRAYPTAGIPTFSPVGDQVERAMVFAIARQESAFNPRAQSSAGARGLMQLMPATAKRTAQRFGMSFDIKRLIDDPAYNAKLGSAHLGELMQDWRGSHILAFASYNAGGGNVKKWIDAYGDPRKPQTDLVDWIERIPFYETRNYVQRVMENLVIYRQCLDGSVAAVNSVSTTPQAQY